MKFETPLKEKGIEFEGWVDDIIHFIGGTGMVLGIISIIMLTIKTIWDIAFGGFCWEEPIFILVFLIWHKFCEYVYETTKPEQNNNN